MHPPAKLEKHAGESFDMLRGFYNDKQMIKIELFNKCSKFRDVGR